MEDQQSQKTHFGFEEVNESDKNRRVKDVFSSVASQYDIMNDLMSGGLHRVWKHIAVTLSGVREGSRVLDIAGGTGDLSKRYLKKIGERGELWLTDINGEMLTVGRDRLIDDGFMPPLCQCDAESLPYPDNYFDCVTVAFGLRNMTHKDKALEEMHRVLKRGGRLIVLEFSKVWKPLEKLYDLYSFKLLPLMGRLVAKDEASYRYLAESIRMHPAQEELAQMMRAAGFERAEFFNLTAGVVAIHRGTKD
ncbi:MAG: bifunctional demethylmenaquinone methyltransferase/2-methoxy-6-polyprenyl-1,4-benzoquinol methylase UbiE [Betaproteobacteria bacterium]